MSSPLQRFGSMLDDYSRAAESSTEILNPTVSYGSR